MFASSPIPVLILVHSILSTLCLSWQVVGICRAKPLKLAYKRLAPAFPGLLINCSFGFVLCHLQVAGISSRQTAEAGAARHQ
jgi:hypothetical protein